MITAVELFNFKCFRKTAVPFGGLTVLTGLNGSGKSTVIQALLVLRQSYLAGYLESGSLLLSGELVDIGAGSDVLHEEAQEDAIGIKLIDGEGFDFLYAYDRNSNELKSNQACATSSVQYLPIFSSSFSYLRAERNGPRTVSPMSERNIREKDLGRDGELVLHNIATYGTSLLDSKDRRLKDSADSCSLLDQVVAWMQDVSPGASIDIRMIREADLVVAGYSFAREGDVRSRGYRPTNVGFGLSYSLPIIYSLLSAKPGALVVVENPEAHLHPRGQTRLGQLAVKAAAAGVQVVVETHSDHFLDGMRLEVRRSSVPPELCRINYFSRVGISASVESPELDADGRLSHWPVGFFDQQDLNLAELVAPKEF
ncbi:TPA: DUF3696 domain-containing protein [Stenotrophomonas maltophilia]|jgi:predicted ATPase|nr:DUF3696 domain-containing protein [Stenotrophomonas maltophilia]